MRRAEMTMRKYHQRGLSIVEMMVGVTIGLFVVAAVTMLVSSQLSGNRRLLLDTQLQQDLRASADLVTRELRRAGARSDGSAQGLIWTPASPSLSLTGMASANQINVTAGDTGQVLYSYERALGSLAGYGFKLQNNIIRSQVAANNWQDLTDSSTLKVTAFTITPDNETPTTLPCPSLCPAPPPGGDGTECWPQLVVRSLTVSITAQAANDASVTRSITTRARVRNDEVVNRSGFADRVCP